MLRQIFVLFFIVLSTYYTTISILRPSSALKKVPRKQYYTHAGILPVLHCTDGTYIIFCKLQASKNKRVYGDFGSAPLKKDGNNPLITATRSFAEHTGICCDIVLDLIKKQCTKDSCVLKNNTGRSIIYPLEFTAQEFPVLKDTKKDCAFIDITYLKKAVETTKHHRLLVLKSKQGLLCTLQATITQALINNMHATKHTVVKNIFERCKHSKSSY